MHQLSVCTLDGQARGPDLGQALGVGRERAVWMVSSPHNVASQGCAESVALLERMLVHELVELGVPFPGIATDHDPVARAKQEL